MKLVMKKLIFLLIQLFFSFFILMLISALPALFDGMELNIRQYGEYILLLAQKLISFNNDTFWEKGPLFPLIFEKAGDSFYLLFLALGFSFITAVSLTAIAVVWMRKKLSRLEEVLKLIESVPDILIISGLQFTILAVYKQTGFMAAKVVTVGDSKSILLPVICLGIPAIIYLMKIFLIAIEKEFSESYAELAKSIGASPFYILTVHISRNIFHEIFISSRTLIWSMLSTLFIIEYLFNYQGLLGFLFTFRAPEVFLVGTAVLFLPFFIIYKSYSLLVPNVVKGEKRE